MIVIGSKSKANNLIGKPIVFHSSLYNKVTPCILGDGRCTCCNVTGPWISNEIYDSIVDHLDGILLLVRPEVRSKIIHRFLVMQSETRKTILHGDTNWLNYDGTNCLFAHKNKDGNCEGCTIHQYALENNISYYDIKPTDCILYPVVPKLENDMVYLYMGTHINKPGDAALRCVHDTHSDNDPMLVDYYKDEIINVFDITEQQYNTLKTNYEPKVR